MRIVLTLLAAAGLLLAGSPTASAADCSTNPASDGVTHPIRAGHYVYLENATGFEAMKIGFWKESNNVRNLQTDDCVVGSSFHYAKDEKVNGLVLA